MPSAPISGDMPKSRSVFAKRMKLLSQIITPNLKLQPNGLHTAYMLKKGRPCKPKSGAALISAEKRFVQGLGCIRADATSVRSRAAKYAAASKRSSYSSVPLEGSDLQSSFPRAKLKPRVIADRLSRMAASWDNDSRIPSTMTRSWLATE